MRLTGMYWGARLLKYVGFPTSDVLGPEATAGQIESLIDEHGEILVKPVFKGGVGRKGKVGLIGRARDVATALRQKERLYFAEHMHGYQRVKAEGVTYEGYVPAKYEVYVSISDNTSFRAPTITLTHHGGVDIEDLPADKVGVAPFDPMTGFKGFVVSKLLSAIDAPADMIGPLVQHLPKLWDLYNNFGMTLLELNPIRIRREESGELIPVACDFKCSFDTDDPHWHRLGLPADLDGAGYSQFELDVGHLRTHQGRSDVWLLNDEGTITPMTFGGGANTLVTELLGARANISTDFAGNPPYDKMLAISRVVYRYWLAQTNVLFIIGGKANNTDIYETFRAMADGLREYFTTRGPTPLFVVVGRGGPNLVRGMGYLRDNLEALGLPYSIFGHDSAMSDVVAYAKDVDRWMAAGGRAQVAARLGLAAQGVTS